MQLDALAANVDMMHLQTVDTSAAPVISSGANQSALAELPPSSTAAPASAVDPASPHEADNSTAEKDGPCEDEVMPSAVAPVVSDADDDASRTDSVSTTDEAFSAPTCTCTHFREHLICSYTVYAYCALLGCGCAMGAVYSLELTPGL